MSATKPLLHVAAIGHVYGDAFAPQPGDNGLSLSLGAFTQWNDDDAWRFALGRIDHHRQALDPRRPADRGCVRPAERFDQPIVAAAGDHRSLRAEPVGDEFERGVA